MKSFEADTRHGQQLARGNEVEARGGKQEAAE
jgi:hypothetical protein